VTKAQHYDWSELSRHLVMEMVSLAGPMVIQKNLTPKSYTSIIRKIIRFFQIPIHIRSSYGPSPEPDCVWIGGLYDGRLDKKNLKAITLTLHFNVDAKSIKIKKSDFKKMCASFADTLLHEIIHTRQYRRRGFVDIPGYLSTAQAGRQRSEQNYLGHPDEIDAYSFNIVCQLLDQFRNDQKKLVKYLNSDLSNKKKPDNPFISYLKAFDHDHDHIVIKRLKKKIINYMSNAKEIGKPYKTTDWLKK